MIYAGIDAGSRAIKIAIIDGDTHTLLASSCQAQGIDPGAKATAAYHELLKAEGLTTEMVGGVVATGYGRNAVQVADTTITEITCHAAGIHHVSPDARTVIEIGGQDSKLLKLEADGAVLDFAMNDRCAAGTGRFLEMVADKLEVKLDGLGELAKNSLAPATISSMCVVFAETEIIGLLSNGTPREDIVAGVQNSIASRIASMAGRRIQAPIVFTGGVAMIPGMRQALETVLEQPIAVAENPQITGALGAALLAHKRFG